VNGYGFGWYADYNDPFDFQDDVLRWLEDLGVAKPAVDQAITRVSLQRDGEGASVSVEKFVTPIRALVDGHIPTETLTLPLSKLPPRRPF
jgi:hypothetical protein